MPEENLTLLASLKVGPAWIKAGKRGYVSRRIPFNSNKKMHWAERARWTTAWKNEVSGVVMQNKKILGKLPLERPRIEIILSAIQTMDRDNAYHACKAIIDGLKVPKRMNDIGAGILIDDDEDHLDLVVRQVKVPTIKEEGVTINIYV